MKNLHRIATVTMGALLAACSSSNDGPTTSAPVAAEPPPQHESYNLGQFSFAFAENATRYKTEVIATINDLAQHDPRCARVDTQSLISVSERKSSDPLLQVACTNAGGQQRAVQFHAKDAENHPLPNDTATLKKAVALKECNLNTSVRLERSVNISPDFTFRADPDYRSTLTGTVDYDGRQRTVTCSFVGNSFRGVLIG